MCPLCSYRNQNSWTATNLLQERSPEASAWYHFLTTSMFVFLTNTGAGVRLGPNSSCPTVICIYNYIYICIPSVWQQDQVMPLFQNPWHHIEWATWRQFNDNSIMQRQFITLASAPDSATPIWPHVNSRSISQIQASWELDRSLNLKGNSNTECYKESTSGG